MVTTKEFGIRKLQSIIYQYYKLKLQCTVYSAALHGCTALHCFLSFQVSLQCDSHFSHDWAPQESLKSSSGDSLGSHCYKRPAKARRPAIWLAYIQAAVGSGPVEHLGAVGIYPKGPSLWYVRGLGRWSKKNIIYADAQHYLYWCRVGWCVKNSQQMCRHPQPSFAASHITDFLRKVCILVVLSFFKERSAGLVALVLFRLGTGASLMM